MSSEEIDYILDAVSFVAKYGEQFLSAILSHGPGEMLIKTKTPSKSHTEEKTLSLFLEGKSKTLSSIKTIFTIISCIPNNLNSCYENFI